MRIGVCNDIATEEAHYTTTHLGMSALEMGHEAWLIGVGDFASDPDDCVRAWARAAPRKAYRSPKTYLTDIQGDKAKVKRGSPSTNSTCCSCATTPLPTSAGGRGHRPRASSLVSTLSATE
jgi:hypothetical protein